MASSSSSSYRDLTARAAEARRRRGSVHVREWTPQSAPESTAVNEKEHQFTSDWCREIWSAPPNILQYVLVDYLLHGMQEAPRYAMPRLVNVVREVALSELPVPTTEDELIAAVGGLVQTVMQLASADGPRPPLPPQRLERRPVHRILGFIPRRSTPATGTRVAPVAHRSQASGDVRSARLHALSTPYSGRVVPGGGSAPTVRRVAEQLEDVWVPLGKGEGEVKGTHPGGQR